MIPDSKADWVEAFYACGLSDTLIAFALGEPQDDEFLIHCGRDLLSQPFEYLPSVPGPPVTPLWHVTTFVVGCRQTHGSIEFVEVAMEDVFCEDLNRLNQAVEVIAHSEQGLWAWLFRKRLESAETENEIELLKTVAERVGFRHFDDAISHLSDYDKYVAWALLL